MPGVEEREKKIGKRIAGISGRVIALSGILFVAGGFAIIIYQFHYWLKIEKWAAMPFSVILSKLFSLNVLYQSEWKWITKSVIWVLNQSSALILIFMGVMVAVIGDIIYLHAAKDNIRSRRR